MLELNEMIALMAASLVAVHVERGYPPTTIESAVRDAKKIWLEVLKQEREE